MNHKHLHYMETAAFASINHDHRSIRAGKLPRIRQTNGPNRICRHHCNCKLWWKQFLHVCKRSPDLNVSGSEQRCSLQIICTLHHLTFHPSFYHGAIPSKCDCIHAKQQPLTSGSNRASSHDMQTLFTLQSIPKQHFKREQADKPSKPLWQIDYMRRPIGACSLEVSVCHRKVLFGA